MDAFSCHSARVSIGHQQSEPQQLSKNTEGGLRRCDSAADTCIGDRYPRDPTEHGVLLHVHEIGLAGKGPVVGIGQQHSAELGISMLYAAVVHCSGAVLCRQRQSSC